MVTLYTSETAMTSFNLSSSRHTGSKLRQAGSVKVCLIALTGSAAQLHSPCRDDTWSLTFTEI